MRILVLGGTAWLGRTVVRHALDRGHEVTCLARGTDVPAGARSVVADRDRDDALAEVLDGSRWDAVVDVSRTPDHVRRAVTALEPVADRYVFVSTVSVYASQGERGADERAPVLEPSDDPAEYGAAKVACERAVLHAFGVERASIARAGLVGGPGDHTGRSGYWPWRFARGAETGRPVVVPARTDRPTSVVDVRDLAAWLVGAAEGGRAGVHDVTGEVRTLDRHLEAARTVAAADVPVVPLADAVLLERGVAPWAGERSLPLWIPDDEHQGMNDRPAVRARSAGLTRRPLAETLADALAWERQQPVHPHGAGLSDDDDEDAVRAAG
ncbi:NAD-dependent epimerase/dehydratase family protein [Curtobacterium sp. MCBA15_012]|uniref:NAD-dependent epimerase/dehydratase family protein n=1 Tax=Curtobacterium sp. MCBA15_012 TaxID=1898738 RepID=UPI0008DE1496|nr:NAD-dependent epimerase/dehydratase family protein [Curtobacterium sp. MCBA15_012]WIB00480.1 NAD-dependent epimerase/dehydratase family protein [Curtobacterium sp. MCBA15_012]